MIALIVGTLFFLGVNALFWGAYMLFERFYDRRLDRQIAMSRHPSTRRAYPTSNVRVIA